MYFIGIYLGLLSVSIHAENECVDVRVATCQGYQWNYSVCSHFGPKYAECGIEEKSSDSYKTIPSKNVAKRRSYRQRSRPQIPVKTKVKQTIARWSSPGGLALLTSSPSYQKERTLRLWVRCDLEKDLIFKERKWEHKVHSISIERSEGVFKKDSLTGFKLHLGYIYRHNEGYDVRRMMSSLLGSCHVKSNSDISKADFNLDIQCTKDGLVVAKYRVNLKQNEFYDPYFGEGTVEFFNRESIDLKDDIVDAGLVNCTGNKDMRRIL